MIFSILMLTSVHSDLLVSLSKEDIVLKILKQETQTRCADNFGTITRFVDDFEMKLWDQQRAINKDENLSNLCIEYWQ